MSPHITSGASSQVDNPNLNLRINIEYAHTSSQSSISIYNVYLFRTNILVYSFVYVVKTRIDSFANFSPILSPIHTLELTHIHYILLTSPLFATYWWWSLYVNVCVSSLFRPPYLYRRCCRWYWWRGTAMRMATVWFGELVGNTILQWK